MRRSRSLASREDGVTIVIVALSLVAIFGMVVLVVDVGGLLLKRRAMVNGADAAALAAAQECAKQGGTLVAAETQADTLGADNVAGLTDTSGGIVASSPECGTSDSGYVTAQYTVPQRLFFAPVLGAGTTNDVTTKATAVWEPLGSGTPVPLVVYSSAFQGNCDIPDDPNDPFPVGERCYFWYDNDLLSGSAFGFLNLIDDPNHAKWGWDVPMNHTCSDAGSLILEWIDGNPVDLTAVEARYPDPTYVCRDSGLQQTGWNNNLAALIGQTLLFPLNRCDTTMPPDFGQVAKVANSYQHITCDGELLGGDPFSSNDNVPADKYDIVGFIGLTLIDVLDPASAGGDTYQCGPGTRAFPTASPLNLDSYGVAEGCFSSPPDQIIPSSVTVSKAGGPGSQPLEDVDWRYDEATREITWLPAGPAAEDADYTIGFDFAVGGQCGVPPNNQSGHCIIVELAEIQIHPGGPGQGAPGSNVRGVKLCDPTIEDSCSPVSVPT